MLGILFFLLTVALGYGAAVLQTRLRLPLLIPLVLATATWAAWDSTRIRIREYKSGIALSPVALWIGIVMLWLIGLPWYLTVRYRISQGTQPRAVPRPAQ